MNTRFGLSAKTPSTDPHVHFSWPGNWLSGLGPSFTPSYGPVRPPPPVSPGTAANPAPGRACPRTGHRFARKNPISTPKATVKSVGPALRIVSSASLRAKMHPRKRERSLLLAVLLSIDLTPLHDTPLALLCCAR